MNHDAYLYAVDFLSPDCSDDERRMCREHLVALGATDALQWFDRCTQFRFCPDSELPF